MERIIELGLYSLAYGAMIAGFIFGTMIAIHTIMQDNYEK
jgi:hypothetical protein|tara:strand:- start:822 stop:941 length:120 start_codon:yes stop_codon:yes gene_type:complete